MRKETLQTILGAPESYLTLKEAAQNGQEA
jgi:hypothetical protein